jgi:hypothetical protein
MDFIMFMYFLSLKNCIGNKDTNKSQLKEYLKPPKGNFYLFFTFMVKLTVQGMSKKSFVFFMHHAL